MAQIACRGVSKRFGDVEAVSNVSFEAPAGTVSLLLGPSGSGKTTLLRIIAGLERPDAGRVLIGGNVVTGPDVMVPPHERGLAFVFQRPTLWPHLDARDNVALALAGRGMSRRDRRARAERGLARLGMAGRSRAYPATLSGGEMQRVSLARALVTEPRVLLLDEPFAALDEELRADVASHLARLKSEAGMTMLWVTHRHQEATALADKTFLLRGGVLEQGELSCA